MKNFQIGDFVKVTFNGTHSYELEETGKRVLYGELGYINTSKKEFGIYFFDKSEFSEHFSNIKYKFEGNNRGLDVKLEHIYLDANILKTLGFKIIYDNENILNAEFNFMSSSFNSADNLSIVYIIGSSDNDYSRLTNKEVWEGDSPHTKITTIYTVSDLQLLIKTIYKPSNFPNWEELKKYLISIQTLNN